MISAPWLCAFAIAVSASSPLAQTIRGRVVGPDGKPCAGAQVFVVDASGGFPFQGVGAEPLIRGRTNARGNFAFDASRMLPDGKYSLWVITSAFADHRIDDVRRPEGGESNLGKIALQPGIIVTGRVLTAKKGEPVAGATVRILTPMAQTTLAAPGRINGWAAVADENGRYSIRNAPVGWVHISAVAAGLALDYETAQLRRGVENEHAFRLAPGRSVVGVVRDAKGQPVAGARISAQSRALAQRMMKQQKQIGPMPLHVALSDEKGRFTMHGVKSGGSYYVTAVASGYLPKRGMAIQATTKELEVQLEACPKLKMKVLGKGGSALSRFRVRLVNSSAHLRVTGFSMPVVVDGVATLTGLPRGSYCLDVRAKGYAQKISPRFTLDPTAETPFVVLQLDTGGSLAGRVVDAAGKPVAGAVVTPERSTALSNNPLARALKASVQDPKVTATTNAKGGFRIPLMRPGSYVVTVSHRDYVRTIVGPVEIEQGETRDQANMVLHNGVRVSGVTKSGGKPSGNMRVQFNSGRCVLETTSDAEGRFELPQKVAPGRYTVMFASPKANPLEMLSALNKSKRQIEIKAGKEQKLELDLVK